MHIIFILTVYNYYFKCQPFFEHTQNKTLHSDLIKEVHIQNFYQKESIRLPNSQSIPVLMVLSGHQRKNSQLLLLFFWLHLLPCYLQQLFSLEATRKMNIILGMNYCCILGRKQNNMAFSYQISDINQNSVLSILVQFSTLWAWII